MPVKSSDNINDNYYIFEKRIKSPELGYYYLAGRIVLSCFTRPHINLYEDEEKQLREIVKNRIKFSQGRICQSWCNLAGYSHKKVAKSILEYNLALLYNCADKKNVV